MRAPRCGRVASPWARLDLALLAVALAAIVVVVQHPHANVETGRVYRFPVHLDEYYHWGMFTAMQRSGSLSFDDPFSGSRGEFSFASSLHERGFHAFWAVIQEATGLDWVLVFLLAPTAVATFLGLAVFALARRWGAGSLAALWVAAIPTTLRFLGPGFLVPIAFALPLVVVGLFAIFHLRGTGSLLVFSLLAAALWPIHAMGALALLLAGGIFAVERLVRSPRVAIGWLVAALLPFLAAWPYYAPLLVAPLQEATLPAALDVIRAAGAGVFLFGAAGFALFSTARDTEHRAAAGALGLVTVALLLVVIHRAETGRDLLRLYDRSVLALFLLITIGAGVGMAKLARRSVRASRWRPAAVAAVVLLLAIQAAVIVGAARAQMRQDYYEVLSSEEHDAYLAAADALGPEHRRALVRGLPTMAFSAITGIPTLHVAGPASADAPDEIDSFFADGAADTYFLLSTGTTVVVTRGTVDNPDLVPVAPGVYALRDDIVARLPR